MVVVLVATTLSMDASSCFPPAKVNTRSPLEVGGVVNVIVTFPGDVPVASSCCVAVPVNVAVAPTPETMDALAVLPAPVVIVA